MILFKRDWARYPNAIVDTGTKNKSFLRYAYVLRKMGVENHTWPLALLQPELKDVDPFSPDITPDQLAMIQYECKWNPIYYFREIARFKGGGGGLPIPYEANRANMALTWSFLNHIMFALIMIRQAGKSGSTDQIHNMVTNVSGSATSTLLYTKDAQLRKANIERIKEIRDLMPAALNLFDPRIDADNTVEITCDALQNQIMTAVGQRSEDAADNIGRGITAQFFHGDEIPYTPNCHISIPVALSSGNAAQDQAAKAGGFYGNVFTTTAGKKDTDEGAYAYKLIHEGMYWTEKILDCKDVNEAIDMITKNSKGERVIINGTFGHLQIGKTTEWLRKKIVSAGGDVDAINRDYFNVWTSGSESSPLSQKLNTVIRDSESDPLYVETTPENYNMRWHVDQFEIEGLLDRDWHILPLDSSQAIGKDNNGLTLLNARDLSLTALSTVAEANILKYASWIARIMIANPKIIFVPENAASGQSIIDIVATKLISVGINPFTRIFNRVVGDDEGPHREIWRTLQKKKTVIDDSTYEKYKGLFGFKTGQASRHHLYDTVLQQAASSSGHKVKDKVLIDELLSLVSKNGRVDHKKGGHDDSVISWLLGHWFLRHAKRLDYYGMGSTDYLTEVSDDGATSSQEELDLKREQLVLRNEIDRLKHALSQTSEASSIMKLERQIAALAKRSLLDGGEPVSMDAIMKSIKEQTKKKRSLKSALLKHSFR